MQRKLSQTIKFLWHEIQKQKVRVSEKSNKKNYLVRKLCYTLSGYFCTRGFTTCTKDENYVFKFGVRTLDESIVFVSCFCRVRLLVLFSLRQMRKTEQDKQGERAGRTCRVVHVLEG